MAAPSLTEEQLREEFRAGVAAALRSWSCLRTAVESGWGGPQSREKAEILRRSICEHLDGPRHPPALDQSDLEDALAIYLEEEFSLTLEDGSEKQVADALLRMHRDCFGPRPDPALCRRMVESAARAEALLAAHPAQIRSSEFDDDDDDMEDVGEATAQQQQPSLAQAYASQSLFGGALPATKGQLAPAEPVRQLGESPPEKMEPELDDDGFAPVAKKKNKKKNPM